MRSAPGFLLLSLCAGLVALTGGAAEARTPTPTSTSTPSPPATATPAGPKPAAFNVSAWVNAHQAGGQLSAKIGQTVCATSHAVVSTGGGVLFRLSVPAQEVLPGCGYEGATITFYINGQQAPQTAVWHSGEDQFLDLIIGPPFARFGGGLSVDHDRLPGGDTVVPYVGDAACGYTLVAPTGDGYGVFVYSDLQQSGCGLGGSVVTFKLFDGQRNVAGVANRTGVWHEWDGVSDPQRLDLIFGPPGGIKMANTGTGGPPPDDATPWAGLLLGLSVAGAIAVALGIALRRRARAL